MWRLTCLTLALLLCVKVYAHGPIYPRVPGGANATPGAWPWMVSVHNPTCHICGGSLITNEWVLSAAHCFISARPCSLRVYLGKWAQRGANNQEIMMGVRDIEIHSQYNYKNKNNDIALLRLTSSVNTNAFIDTVCLAAKDSDFPPGTSSWIIGWGQTAPSVNLPYPGILQQANVFVVDNNQCHNQLKSQRGYTRITGNMICAGVPTGGISVYYGDSGGPMMSTHGCSQWVQSGITSFGYGCAQPNTPGVYTRVSQYQQWITTIIQSYQSQNLPRFVTLSSSCSSSQSSRKSKCNLCCFGR